MKTIPRHNRRRSAYLLSFSQFGAAVCLLTLVFAGQGWAEPSTSKAAAKKAQAAKQYETAQRMREALNGRPAKDRTRKDYLNVANAFRRVYFLSPASSKADESVMAEAETLAEMGHQFQPGEKELHAAIKKYEFLRREYPGSKYRMEALFTIGQIYKEDLGDNVEAKATFEEFLKHYPHNELAPKAQEAIAEMNAPKPKSKTETAKAGTAPDTQGGNDGKADAPRVTGIRYWSTADYTRVAIDLESEVKYESGRVPDPDRIFFDLSNTRLASTLVGKTFDVQDGFLKQIRVAQYQPGATRIVLDVDDVTEYSAFLLPNPFRLIIDIHGSGSRPASQVAAAEAEAAAAGSETTKVTKTESATKSDTKTSKGAGNAGTGSAPSKPAETTTTAFKSANGDLAPAKNTADAAASNPAGTTSGKTTKSATPSTVAKSPVVAPKAENDSDEIDMAAAKPTNTKPSTAPTAVTVAASDKKASKKKRTSDDEVVPVHAAAPTSAGDRSLIRALGLKIGTIVVDAGHGGHDTGTIGPNGLLEKDLVLDVALRLGKLLQARLGANVIYTRDDDTFIPLETRTAIANEHRADMFISVHANSSRDASARGVETYYLNFTTNAAALEVAARENAVSETSIYELQDLVKKIALKDKIEESRELAGDVQSSLYAGLSPKNPTLKNRGVKKAPFVVLIGANMPSILAEISFVSNPTDEKKLQTPDYRQKIAESLYKGIAKYVDGLSGVKVAERYGKDAGK